MGQMLIRMTECKRVATPSAVESPEVVKCVIKLGSTQVVESQKGKKEISGRDKRSSFEQIYFLESHALLTLIINI